MYIYILLIFPTVSILCASHVLAFSISFQLCGVRTPGLIKEVGGSGILEL